MLAKACGGSDAPSAPVTSNRHRRRKSFDNIGSNDSVSYVTFLRFSLRPLACMMMGNQLIRFKVQPRRPSMLHKCANPTCPRPFRSLNHGKLFLLEIDHVPAEVIPKTATAIRKERTARRMERYWLCDELFFSSHPDLSARTGDGYSSASCQEHPSPCPASDARAGRIKELPHGVEGDSMKYSKISRCAICGEERSGNEPRFLLAENSWEDKLTILHWNENLASRDGIQVACGLDHAEELAILWMTTGRLDYPFARTALGASAWRHISRPSSVD